MRSFRGREPLSGVRLCKRTRSSDASATTDITVARGATVGRRDATRAPVTAVEALRDIYGPARIHARTRARQSSRTRQNDHTHHETPFPRPPSSPPPSRGRPASPFAHRRRETLGHHPSRVRGPSRRPGHARDRRARPRARETSRNNFTRESKRSRARTAFAESDIIVESVRSDGQ